MIIKKALEEETVLRVLSIKLGFSHILPPSTNYTDAHGILPIFSLRWGRGVLTSSTNGYDAIIGKNNSSHAMLKKSLNSDERSAGTFYWGYDTSNKTLYLEYASDRTFDFDNGKVINAIMNALQSSNTCMRNFRTKG